MDEFISSFPIDVREKAEETGRYKKNFKPIAKTWKGVNFVPALSVEAAKYAYDHWTPRKGDVFVMTHPKCGSHWMTELVKQIYFIRDEKMMELMSLRGEGLLWGQLVLERGPAAKFAVCDQYPCPRIFMSHLPEDLVNTKKIKEVGAKVILVFRNPKDTLVSYFNFLKNIPLAEDSKYLKDVVWEEFLRLTVEGKIPTSVPAGEWYPYFINSWLKHKKEDYVKIFSYEALKKDLLAVAKEIAKFLGVERTGDEFAEIIKRCSFNSMKSSQNDFLKNRKMYRKGQVGSWKNQFTVAQSEMLDEILKHQLGDADIDFIYEL